MAVQMRRNVKKPIQPAKHKRKLSQDEVDSNCESTDHAKDNISSEDKPRSCLRRFCDNLSFMKFVVLIIILPPILNLAALQREATGIHYEGEKVDVGWGQKMHIHCKGSGVPTVILDAPTGFNSDIWIHVHRHLSQLTQVCIYDRSGIGDSDATFTSEKDYKLNKRIIAPASTVRQMTSDLNHLVTRAYPLPHPLILVGSGIGALIARMYATVHPTDVSDIVLIDPVVENLFSESEEFSEHWYSNLLPSYEYRHLAAFVGMSRLAVILDLWQPIFFKQDVPDDYLLRQKSLLCNPWHIGSAFYEHVHMNSSFAQMNEVLEENPFPEHVSVTVIRREELEEYPPDLQEAWKKSQDYLVDKLHPFSQSFIFEEKSILKLYSRTSRIVDVVKNVVDSWRERFGGFPTFVQ